MQAAFRHDSGRLGKSVLEVESAGALEMLRGRNQGRI